MRQGLVEKSQEPMGMGSWLLEDLETRETRARARRQERCHERRRRLSVYGQRAKRANLQPLTS